MADHRDIRQLDVLLPRFVDVSNPNDLLTLAQIKFAARNAEKALSYLESFFKLE